MSLKTFDAKSVSMIFGAIEVTDGLADGTFVSVEMRNPAFNLMVGADGNACRAKSNDASATITFTLLQSSLANDLLSAQHSLDLATPNGDGIAPLLIKDNTGRTLLTAQKAWITQRATVEYARETSNREWVLETDSLGGLVGGN